MLFLATQVLDEAEAPLNSTQLPNTPLLKTKLSELKRKLGLKFIQNSHGFKVRGSLSHLTEFENAIGVSDMQDLDTDMIIDFKESKHIDEVSRFFGGQSWGNVYGTVLSSFNIKFIPAKLCFFLLDKRDQITELLHECNGQSRNGYQMRLQ